MNEFKKGWGPLLAATVGMMCGLLTITNYSQGFFVGPVTADLGWSPPEFFFAFTITVCLCVMGSGRTMHIARNRFQISLIYLKSR